MRNNDRQTRILYINGSFLNESGSSVIARNTYDLFTQNDNFQVEYFTTKEFCDDKNYKFYKYFPCVMNTFSKYIINIWTYYYNWKAMFGMKKVLREFQPDIVHVHSLRYPSMTYSVLKPIIVKKIPIIMTLHDAYLVCPMMTLVNGKGKNCTNICCKDYNKFYCVLHKCAPKGFEQSFRVSLLSFINRLTNYDKYITKFITPSDALKKLMVDNFKYTTSKNTITVNNYLAKNEFGNVIPNYSNKKYFLYLGRLDKEKGVNYLLQAVKELPKEIEFHIVGKGQEEENLKKYANLNILDNVKFLGFKNREEIKAEYQNCIATILPCNWFEIFGMINIESFINGKPVIASNIGGIPEIVENNVNGLLFEPTNVEQLKECILKYWNNPDLVVEHGKNAYQKAVTRYSEEKYYNDLMQIYEEVINHGKTK